MRAGPARRRSAVAALALALAAADARADDAATDWRASAELAVSASPARADAPANPGLVDARRGEAGPALHVNARHAAGDLVLTADGWLQARRDWLRGETVSHGYLPEASASWQAGSSVNLSAGIGAFRWGSGYSWNPANPLTDVQANNTSRALAYRRDGDPFASIEFAFGQDLLALTVAQLRQTDRLLDRQERRENRAVLRYQAMFDGADITAFAAAGDGESFGGLSASAAPGDQLELHAELGLRSRRRAPSVRAVDLGPAQAPLAVLDFAPRPVATLSGLVGGQYTFADSTNLIVEFFHDGNGLSRGEFDALRAGIASSRERLDDPAFGAAAQGFLKDTTRLAGRMRRDYLFVRVARDELFARTDLHAYARTGLADGATVWGLLLRRAITPALRVQAGVELYRGDADSEARLIPVRQRVEAALIADF